MNTKEVVEESESTMGRTMEAGANQLHVQLSLSNHGEEDNSYDSWNDDYNGDYDADTDHEEVVSSRINGYIPVKHIKRTLETKLKQPPGSRQRLALNPVGQTSIPLYSLVLHSKKTVTGTLQANHCKHSIMHSLQEA